MVKYMAQHDSFNWFWKDAEYETISLLATKLSDYNSTICFEDKL